MSVLRDLEMFARPPRGWLRAIREALGMTAAQMAKRLGVSQPRIFAMETAEAQGRITLETLQRAAHALDCRLVYALVPREPLETVVEKQALKRARAQLRPTSHSMALESQSVDAADERAQIDALAKRLLGRPGSGLWDDGESE